MNTTDRNIYILAAARRNGKVNATVLADTFGVPVQIIRRDLTNLCSDGLFERVHGGAILPSGVRNIGYDDRSALGRDAKLRIGARTAALIPDNASIFLNIGTTTEAVAHAISAHCDLMVATDNLNFANILAQIQHVKWLLQEEPCGAQMGDWLGIWLHLRLHSSRSTLL